MKIAVVGVGYVGLVTGACFADLGNDVWCVDVDKEKILNLKQGEIPIYEPGLRELVEKTVGTENLRFTTEINEALAQATICFIAVGTPTGEDGSADLQYVLAVAQEIGQGMLHHMYIVDKSTVPVGTAQMVREAIQRELDKRGSDLTFDVVSNPEFLKEGTAVSDCSRPDRIIIGTDNDNAAKVMKEQGGGVILNTSSMVSIYGQPSGVGYPTSKFAVNGMTKSLARELGKDNIRVNAVAPGITKTDMVAALPEEMIKPLIATIPLGRVGEPEDVANAFLFLASDMASYVTGEILSVDGAAMT